MAVRLATLDAIAETALPFAVSAVSAFSKSMRAGAMPLLRP